MVRDFSARVFIEQKVEFFDFLFKKSCYLIKGRYNIAPYSRDYFFRSLLPQDWRLVLSSEAD